MRGGSLALGLLLMASACGGSGADAGAVATTHVVTTDVTTTPVATTAVATTEGVATDGILDCRDDEVVRSAGIRVSGDSEEAVVADALVQWTGQGGALSQFPDDRSWSVVLDGRDVAVAVPEREGTGTWVVHDVRTCGAPRTVAAPIDGELDCASDFNWLMQIYVTADAIGAPTPEMALRSTMERWQARYGGEVIIEEQVGSLVVDDREQVRADPSEAPAGGWDVLTIAGCEGYELR